DLERNVSNEEIKSVVWDCGMNKSLGPDSFTFEFFCRYWKLLEHEIVAAVKEFFASGIPIDGSLTLSHLFFAGDAIFVGKWDSLNIHTIVNVLKCFHLALGLKINFHKRKLMGIGTRLEEVDATATTIGCSIFTTPFVHLEVKVGGVMSRIKYWDDVVAKVSSRLSKWKLKTLSIVLKLLESIRRNFLMEWTGQKEKWLGLVGIRFIKAIYGEEGALNSPSSLSKRSPWLDIIREEDPWLDDLALKHKFPRLYALDNYKQITVVEKINHASMVDTFRRPPRGGVEEE
ncbi:hypothetical protein Tco_1412237, partial [Tanacetum coccineum]